MLEFEKRITKWNTIDIQLELRQLSVSTIQTKGSYFLWNVYILKTNVTYSL